MNFIVIQESTSKQVASRLTVCAAGVPTAQHGGALDTRITGAVGDLEAALKAASITYQLKIYDGADHAFHNDTGTRYQPTAARDAWQRASEWFGKYV